MHTRRRTVATLAAAATAASLALVTAGSVTSSAQADARTTRLISTGTTTDSTFGGTGGGAVFFRDESGRVYRNIGGTVDLIVDQPVSAVQVSADGSQLVVVTQATLSSSDNDTTADAYRVDVATRAARLLSTSGGTTSVTRAEPVTSNAGRVVFQQGAFAYVVDGTGAPAAINGTEARFVDASSDGSALFYTLEGGALWREIGTNRTQITGPQGTLGASSADGLTGYYVDSNGTYYFHPPQGDVTGDNVANEGTVIGTSPDLSSVSLLTTQVLVPQDVDGAKLDVYRVGRDGSRALLTGAVKDDEPFTVTAGSVTPAGGIAYVYGGRVQVTDAAGNATAVSDPTLGEPQIDAVSSTGRVIWTTIQPGTETALGVYAYENGATTLVARDSSYAGSSADGGTIWFDTTSRLTPADTDDTRDVYEASLTTAPAPGTPTITTPVPTPTPDTTPPAAEVEGKKVQQNDGRIEVRVGCAAAEPCRVTGSGTLLVTVPSARGRKKYTIKAPTTVLAPGQDRVIAFKVRKKVKKSAAKSLRNGGKVKATLHLTVADTSGNDRVIAFKVRLK